MNNTRGTSGLAVAVAVVATGFGAFAQSTANVAGDWALTVQTDQGTTTPSVMLQQDGTALTGHYSSETLGEADVTGSVDGNVVTFSFGASLQGFDLDVSYTGTLQEDGTLSGKISLGEAGSGTFTGKRR